MSAKQSENFFPGGPVQRDSARKRACRLLEDDGSLPPLQEVDDQARHNALATAVMDLFRRTASREAFDCLVHLTASQLMNRVRLRLRYLGDQLDPQEMLQDAFINIYRYPDKFDASRPSAFAAWSSTIVDNTIRRHLRRGQTGLDVSLRPSEMLAQHPDEPCVDPRQRVEDREEYEMAVSGYRVFLAFYLAAYQTLSERERFVLQMVEVRNMRYAQLAGVLGIRPEALKMVVFRARKRIQERITQMMMGAPVAPSRTPTPRPEPELAMAS